jgi:hypothetical protein
MGKAACLLFILIVTLSIGSLTIKPISAQLIPKPSVPEFTLKYVDKSYYVSPITTTTIDPYTGKQIITIEAGYHVQNDSIVVSVKNQPFTSYVDSKYNIINLYNSIRWKGHFVNYWSGSYPENNTFPNNWEYLQASSTDNISDDIDLVLGLYGNNGTGHYDAYAGVIGGQIDFQVISFIGYSTPIEVPPNFMNPHYTYYGNYTGQTSDWSNTQTITIPETSTSTSVSPNPTLSPTSSPNPTPFVPEFSWFMILPLLPFMLSIVVIVKLRKTLRTTQH